MENIIILCYNSLMSYGITFKTKGEDIYYYINWSPLSMADRWEINGKVPSVAGVYEIYWMDDHKHLRLMRVGDTHYGGLRSELRRLVDPELVTDPKEKKLLEDEEIWFRYAPTNSSVVMADIVWYFRQKYVPDNPGVSHSGRYEKIFVQESSTDKLIWVP